MFIIAMFRCSPMGLEERLRYAYSRDPERVESHVFQTGEIVMIVPLLSLFCLLSPTNNTGQMIILEGLPLQLEWFDVNADGHSDLVALMLLSQTEGRVDTFMEDGKLRGFYEDYHVKEKYLATVLYEHGTWREADRISLGTDAILGFALGPADPTQLMLWRKEALFRHEWSGDGWRNKDRFATRGLLAGQSVQLSGFPFWQTSERGAVWLIPDLDGIHLVYADEANERDRYRFLPYPDFMFGEADQPRERHSLEFSMPRMIDIDAGPFPELVFQGNGLASGRDLAAPNIRFDGAAQGTLMDMNGDGLADLVEVEEPEDIDRRKDLPKLKTRVRTFLATAPLKFSATPQNDQMVPGLLLTDVDSEIKLAEPFMDINGDKLPDLAGMAFKLSTFQIAKLVATGRFTITFLLHLNVQQANGTFKTVPDGPFEMVWRINIRRLRLPELAQVAADFDGDGWVDLLMEKGSRLEITPVTGAGYQRSRKWSQKLPDPVRNPDQVYGKDMTGDGKAAFVAVKFESRRTTIAVLEPRP